MGARGHANDKRNERKKRNEKAQRKTAASIDSQHSELFVAPVKETVKPSIQLELTETELEEEIPQMLTANNPLAPQNVARFSNKERTFKLEAMVEQCAIHYATDGWLIAKNSEEGKHQIENERFQEEALAKVQAEVAKGDETNNDTKQLRNHFNFSDRACQTVAQVPKSRGCSTEPPKTTTRNGSCSQWEIYDAYVQDIELQKLRDQANKKRAASIKKVKTRSEDLSDSKEASSDPEKENGVTLRAAKIVERMTMQNVFNVFGMDLKYWDDESDTYRPHEGSLLPLWKFEDFESTGKHVTALCLNPLHLDVFAVGYGSFLCFRQTFGEVQIYSLKNPLVPELSFRTESGVLCLAFHPKHPHLLAAGCHDGSIRVIDSKGNVLYEATRHVEPIWQVSWKTDSNDLQLYSASADGKLGLWMFTPSEVLFEPIMQIAIRKVTNDAVTGHIALDFSPFEATTYLVGTETGHLHRCSTEYDSEYLDSFVDHELPIYAVKWNRFHPDVFLSASEDWTVRLWSTRNDRQPIAKFELNAPVSDISWAPYASTVFAAATASGHVFVFDLAINRHAAICEQKVIVQGKLSKLLFHPQNGLVFVGDTCGMVHAFKLSPNLRKSGTNEQEKLSHVLDIATRSLVRK